MGGITRIAIRTHNKDTVKPIIHQLRSTALPAVVVALSLGFPDSVEAAIIFFTDRVAWASAAGPLSFAENFSGFPVDTPFQTSSVALNGMAIQQEGTERMAYNEVDVLPHQLTPNSGSNLALLLTNFPEEDSYGIQVRIIFTGLNRAFGFDSWSGYDGEGAVLDVFSGATLLGSQALTGGDGDFLGYVLTGVDTATAVRFRSDQLTPGMLGERFYIDNLAGTVAVPRLTMSRVGNAQLQVSWPTNFTGYVLERATGLPATTWTAVTNNVLITGDSFLVASDANAVQQFFRLRKP